MRKATQAMLRLPIEEYKAQSQGRLFSCPPKVVTFDAYNTLYSTKIPVLEHYCLVGKKYGIKGDFDAMLKKFPKIYKELNINHPNYGKHTNLTPNEWWSTLIRGCFEPVKVPDAMVEEILVRFEGSDAYSIYPDLVPLLEKLQSLGCIVAIVSNTDPIMFTLMKNLGLDKFFEQNIFLSYDMEVKKPNPLFFKKVLAKLVNTNPELLDGITMDQLENQYCYHVGDEMENDMLGAFSANWNGVLIDRANKYGFFSNEGKQEELDEAKLATNKIDNNSKDTWAVSSAINDVIVPNAERQLVIPNFRVLESLLNDKTN